MRDGPIENEKQPSIDLLDDIFFVLVDLMPDLVGVHDQEYKILHVNTSAVELLGFVNKKDIIGMSLLELSPDNKHRIIKNIARTAVYGEIDYEEYTMRDAGGLELIVEARAVAISWGGKNAYLIIAHDVTNSKNLLVHYKEFQKEIEIKNAALVQKILDINVLMDQVRLHKKETETNLVSNIETIVLPLLAKIKSKPDSPEHLDLLEKSLNDIISTFGTKIASKLTSREREVIGFIKKGLTNKEIAKTLNLSQRTIDRHRQKIRGKLNLVRTNESLKTWLDNNS